MESDFSGLYWGDTFFVLSGFLITYILLEEKELSGKINLRNFYLRRVLRIWPLYFLVLPFGFFIFPYIYNLEYIFSSNAHRLPYYITFLSNFEAINAYTQGLVANVDVRLMQGITWSVAVEEQFYLIWPILFILIKPRYYIFIFIPIIIGSVLFRLHVQDDYYRLSFHTLAVMVDLAIGGLSAYLVLKYKVVKDFFVKLPLWAASVIYLAGGFVLLIRDHIEYFVPDAKATVHLFYGVYFSFIILHQNFSPDSFLKLGRIKFLTFWGKYSYGIYLLHPIAIGIVSYIVLSLHIVQANFVNYLLIGFASLLLTLGLSYISYELYEKHFLALKKKFAVIVKE